MLGIRYKYENGKNRLSSYNVNLGKIGLNYSTSFTYGNLASGQKLDAVYGVKLNNDDKLQYEYDELGRLETRKILFTSASTPAPFDTTYTYKNKWYNEAINYYMYGEIKNSYDKRSQGDGGLTQ